LALACARTKDAMLLEIGEDWDWDSYVSHVNRMRITYKNVISEYNGMRKNTVGLNDISIVALGKCLSLPVVSMESKAFQASPTRVRIPALCDLEKTEHYTFSEFLRVEGIQT
jgi:hypothetical protein